MSTYAEKLALAAECRAGTALSDGLKPFRTEVREGPYLPGGEKKSVVPRPPPDINEDLSGMNPRAYGKKGGRPRKTPNNDVCESAPKPTS